MSAKASMQNIRRTILFLCSVSIFFIFFPIIGHAHENTPEHNEQHKIEALIVQIDELLALIAMLKEQIAATQIGSDATINSINRNLAIGDEGEDVRNLQILLNSNPSTQIAITGPGSSGNETTYFGNLTASAVIKFQNLYKEEILAPVGLSRGTGFVGPSTLKKINSIASQKNSGGSSDANEYSESNENRAADIETNVSENENDNQTSTNSSSGGGSNSANENDNASDDEEEDDLILGEYECTGTLPDNAAGHGWDEFVYLSADYEWQYSELDTENFCEYYCQNGYERSGSRCTPVVENTLDPNDYTLTRIALTDSHPDPDESHLLDLAFDDKENLWVVGEFHKAFMKIDTKTNDVSHFRLPDDGKIFAWSPKGKTSISSLVEDITRDSSGNIWFTQGGSFFNYESESNHSRIVFVDTDTNEITTYKVPGDHNQIIGIMYDEEANRIYFVESSLVGFAAESPQQKLVSFTPGSIDTSIGYDDPEGLLDLRCEDAQNTDNCYLTEDIPFPVPARLVKGHDGNIYFSGYFHNYLGRYNPATHEFVKFELPAPRSTFSPNLTSSFPWDVAVDPTTGDILMTETFDQQILRFKTSEEVVNSCQIQKTSALGVVTSRGSNSDEDCVVEYEARPPEYAPARDDMTHSLDVDQEGNIWFTTKNYIGVIPVDGSESKFRQIIGGDAVPENKIDEDHMTGIKVNDETGEVWANAFYGREVYRLTPN